MEDTLSTDEKQNIEDGAPMPPLLPVGTQALLNAQLGEALRMMRDFSDWVHGSDTDIVQCCHVGHALGSLMTASATLATVAARLQTGEAETRHRMIVEYVEPEGEGEGVAKSRKRIKADNA
jgi:hypothetical protein